jgi:hypothetical protein
MAKVMCCTSLETYVQAHCRDIGELLSLLHGACFAYYTLADASALPAF